jgi:membrane complex biogenesis BtpA family protein
MPTTQSMTRMFGGKKYIIAGIHFLPLPGSPGYDRGGGMQVILKRAREETRILVGNGVHGILFANEADLPYLQTLGPETVAAFSTLVGEIMAEHRIPYGINVLLDPVAAVGIAHACGASFVRGYFAGGYVTDVGIMDTRGPEALRLRANLGAVHIQLLHNLVCAFGVPFVQRPHAEEAYGIRAHVGVDGFTISGRAAGFAPDPSFFSKVREAVPGVPIVAGTGVSKDNVDQFLEVSDGAIVVTGLRKDGKTLNPVDPRRVRTFMARVMKKLGQT